MSHGPEGRLDPPRFVRWLVARSVAPDALEQVLGDLQEGTRRRRGRSRTAWYLGQATALWLWVRWDRLRVGGRAATRALTTGMRDMAHPGAWFGDVRYALRRMRKAPGFTAVAILSLALGIGANTAIFSLINAVVLVDQPYEAPEELLELYAASDDVEFGVFSHPDYQDVRAATTDVFAGVSGSRFSMAQADGDDGVELLPAQLVSGNFFDLLGVRPQVGRLFTEQDDVSPGGHPVVVLGHGYWERAFGSDPAVVGSELRLNGRLYTIVGVVQPEFDGDLRGMVPDVYAPLMMTNEMNPASVDQLQARSWRSVFVRARLEPGATGAQMEAALERTAVDLRAEYPRQWTADRGFRTVRTEDVIMFPAIDRILVPAIGLLMGVVGIVLLIACANLASFLLARATDRKKEIAIRLAMGARRTVLVRQLLVETGLLAVAGGVAGVFLANGGLSWLLGADLPMPVPITIDASPDSTVLLFTLGVSVLAGLLFGLAPALQATSPDVAPTLKDEGVGGGRPKRWTLRNALVVGQVAGSLVLLIGAALFLRSLQASQSVDPGFGHAPTAIVSIITPLDRYESEDEARAFVRALLDRMAEIQGVSSVGAIDRMQLDPLNTQTFAFNIDGVDAPPDRDWHSADRAAVSPGFFEVSGIEMLEGRDFSAFDTEESESVLIVNRAFVDRFWPGERGVGRTVRSSTGDVEYRVVGVVADSKVRALSEAPRPQVFRPYGQNFSTSLSVMARTSTDAERTALEMYRAGREIDPELIVWETKTMERHLGMRLLPARLSAVISIAFAALAAVLACIGLYGVVSYAVATKTREVGIRMSLGADRRTVVKMLLRSGLRMVALGGVIGIALSLLASGLVGRFLYGVEAVDLVAFSAAPGLLGLVAVLAAWIPARRASRIDPVRALKAD